MNMATYTGSLIIVAKDASLDLVKVIEQNLNWQFTVLKRTFITGIQCSK